MARSILWFRQDLRLHDNESLTEAIRNSEELIPVFVIRFRKDRVSEARKRFLYESLQDLSKQLQSLGSGLLVLKGKPEEVLYQLALDTQSQFIYCNRERTTEEVKEQDQLEKKLWTIGRELRYSRGKMLYYTADLPFPVTHCPDSFATFKKEVEQFIPVRSPLPRPAALPPLPANLNLVEKSSFSLLEKIKSPVASSFHGGEEAGMVALSALVKNNLSPDLGSEEGVLSPWISMGCLSPKKVYHESFSFSENGETIRQGLVYRDYLRLMAKKYGDRIFQKGGIHSVKISFVENALAFDHWAHGKTGVDIIDATMHQLSVTGWIPDVLRKLTAHYFLKILQLDWRLGAIWFESRLIDYDPASNWVSWLNLAGLGPEPNFDRTMNFEGVGKRLDPSGEYVKKWKVS